MPVRIGDIAIAVEPLHPEARLLSVWNRFQDTDEYPMIPVVDGGVPIGIIRRSDLATKLLAAASGGAAVLGTVTDILEDDPIMAELIAPASYVAKQIAEAGKNGLEAGIIATDGGQYAGFVPADELFRTIASENAARAAKMKVLSERVEAQKATTDREIERNSRFLAFVSHEIRTALTGPLGIADLLADAGLDDPYRGYASTLSDSGRLLERLLTDLIDLSRLDANKMPILPEPFKLADFAHETRMVWSKQAGSRNTSLNVTCKSGANTRIEADGMRLRQVVFNLVSNALKFSEGKSVDVTLDVTDSSEDAFGLEIVVSDTGIGISDEEKDRLFGVFEQARSDTVHRYGGSGLGLALAKGLIQKMGGTITLEDNKGGGAVFTVRCPVRRAGPRLAVKNDRPRLANLKLGRILVVDDHDTSRLVITQALTEAGWSIDVVETAEQGVRRANSIEYQAILLDLHLGSASGLQVARQLRQDSGPNQTSVILAVTADARETVRDACERAGLNGVITKPLRPKDLVATLIDTLILADQSTPIDDQIRRLDKARS
ncbi:MAG: ATP-binding protein [Pseudomonadota bacterium]